MYVSKLVDKACEFKLVDSACECKLVDKALNWSPVIMH